MKLWELRSYEATIKLEQERLVYQARLRSRFGRAWRRRAPVESLMPLRLARYGVPLQETAPAGLAAAGIEPTLLPAGPGAGELSQGAGQGPGEDRPGAAHRPDEAPPSHEVAPPPGVNGQSPWFAGHPNRPYEGRYDPSHPPYQQYEQYEQWYAQQQGLGRVPGGPGPQEYGEQGQRAFGPQQYAGERQQVFGPQRHAGERQQYVDAQQYPDARAGQPVPAEQVNADGVPAGPTAVGPGGRDTASDSTIRVPSGPGRTRPLGGNPIPAPRAEQAPLREPAGAHEELPPPEAPSADETQPGVLPDGLSRDEAYFHAFRKYVGEHMDFPNARQFGLYLQDLYGIVGQSGGPLTESTLRPYLRDFRDRYQQNLDADAEHIA